MTRVTLTSKGQITLPAEARRVLGLSKSDTLQVRVDPETRSVVLTKPMDLEQLSKLASSYVKPSQEPVTNVDEYYQKHREGFTNA